jgi:hypothetical protein
VTKFKKKSIATADHSSIFTLSCDRTIFYHREASTREKCNIKKINQPTISGTCSQHCALRNRPKFVSKKRRGRDIKKVCPSLLTFSFAEEKSK